MKKIFTKLKRLLWRWWSRQDDIDGKGLQGDVARGDRARCDMEIDEKEL